MHDQRTSQDLPRRRAFTRNVNFSPSERRLTFESAPSRSYDQDMSAQDPAGGNTTSTSVQDKEGTDSLPSNQSREKLRFVLTSWESQMEELTPKQRALFSQDPQPRDFQDYVSRLQSSIQKRVDNSKLFSLAHKTKPFYDLVNLITPIVSAASQSCPVPPSAILGGITCILSLGVRVYDYQSKVVETLTSMAGELGILEKYRTESLFAGDADIQASQVGVAVDVLNFCVAATNMFFDEDGKEKNGLLLSLKAQWKDFDAKFGDIKSRFQQHVAELEKLRALANSRRLRHIQQGVSAVGDSLQFEQKERRQMIAEMRNANGQRVLEERRSHVLKWLPSLPLGRIQEDTYDRRAKGTGRWLLEHPLFESWRKSPTSDVLWVHGKPGCGKSHLCSRVIYDLNTGDDSDESNPALAYVYCSSTQYTVRMDLNSLLGSILGQLYLRLPPLSEIESIAERAVSGTKEGPQRTEMKEWIRAVCKKLRSCYIIIDGMDECSTLADGNFKDFCSFIASLVELESSSLCIKVIIFSRPNYQLITHAFGRFPQIQVDGGANDDDIKTYISEKVDEVNLDPSPEEHQGFSDIKDMMFNKAGSTFLWVRLKVKDFKDIGSVEDIKETLQDPVEGLDELYGEMIGRILGRPKYSRDRALRALMWVTNAYRSLSKLELLEALSTKPGRSGMNASQRLARDVPLTTECSDLLVEVGGHYQLIHSSLKDFLLLQDPILSPYREYQLEAHDILAETCLTYLNFDVFRSVFEPTPKDVTKLFLEYPLLQYATLYWGDHFSLAHGKQKGQLDSLARELLRANATVSLCIDILEFDEFERGRFLPSDAATPLHLLSILGLHELAQTMPELQALINEHDQFLHLPIDYAMMYEAKDMVKWLLDIYHRRRDEDGEPFVTCMDCCQTYLLHHAVSSDWSDIVESLLSLGCDAERCDYYGKSPVQTAVIEMAYSSLDVLLKTKIDLHSSAPEQLTPLTLAVDLGNLKAVGLLLAAGADVEHRSFRGLTALHHAAVSGEPNVAVELIKSGAEIMTTGPLHGENALHIAAWRGNLGVAEQLLIRCRSLEFVDALNSYGETPLILALKQEHFDVAAEILERGARHDLNEWAQILPQMFFSELSRQYMGTSRYGYDFASDLVRKLESISEAGVQGSSELNRRHQSPTRTLISEAASDVTTKSLTQGETLYEILRETLIPLLKSEELDPQIRMTYDMAWRASRALLKRDLTLDFVDLVQRQIAGDVEGDPEK
ncbi:Ankyrin repeat-like protein [Cladobotryum mycophilum]|uniref:Ankyrin repeat-like protein n=1 Tax=Cladobotryum mycophilum TaxID=491253 RepID=A0ABR0SKF6_9HYPO